jgi:siroheme synthase-like protein
LEDGNELFPVFIKLNQLHTLLVGGGPVGLEKLNALITNSPNAKIKIVALEILPEIIEIGNGNPNIIIYQRAFSPEDLDHVQLVMAATNNAPLNEQIRALATAKNLLVNFADKPALCDFYLGSVVKKGDLKIGISTNGKSPTIAKRLKEILNDNLPEELDKTLQQMSALRNTLEGDFTSKVKKLNQVTSILVEKEKNNGLMFTYKWLVLIILFCIIVALVFFLR